MAQVGSAAPCMRAADLAAALAQEAEAVAVTLLGEPSSRGRIEWRWGRRGSLALRLDRRKRGKWYDHETGTGGDMLELVRREVGGDMAAAMDWARRRLGAEDAGNSAPVVRQKVAVQVDVDRAGDEGARIRAAGRIWREAADASGSIVERYLSGRGLALPHRYHDVIRYSPGCPFKRERVPCMVALLRDVVTDQPCGVHRTALLADGSDRDRARGKAMLGRSGAAVAKISSSDTVSLGLGVAEGVETSLAVLGAGWAPIWAAGSAGAIAQFPLLPGVESLTVFTDHDLAGQRAARACADRWAAAGWEVLIRYPKAAGRDWCDESAAA